MEMRTMKGENEFMGDGENVQPASAKFATAARRPTPEAIEHLYVHIPFCARICPYCAFYKELLDRSETPRFCQAVLAELKQVALATAGRSSGGQDQHLLPSTIYFGGGTPTALTTPHLPFLLGG